MLNINTDTDMVAATNSIHANDIVTMLELSGISSHLNSITLAKQLIAEYITKYGVSLPYSATMRLLPAVDSHNSTLLSLNSRPMQ